MNRGLLRTFVDELIPRGFFWDGDPRERLIDALTDGFLPHATRANALRDEIHPDSAKRPVLVQWWDFLLPLQCRAIPADTEDLRAAVLGIIGLTGADTPAGLKGYIKSVLPYARATDNLPVSQAAFEFPVEFEHTGRVLEVWHAPLIHPAETVRCVVRPVARGADELRLVVPDLELHAVDSRGDGVALRHTFIEHTSEIYAERAATVGGAATETATITPADRHGTKLMSDIFPLVAAGDDVSHQSFRFYPQVDFGGGDTQLAATKAKTPSVYVAEDVLDEVVDYHWAGRKEDMVIGETLVVQATATEIEATTGLVSEHGISEVALSFADGTNDGWLASGDTSLGDLGDTSVGQPTPPIHTWFLVFRVNGGLPAANRGIIRKRFSGTTAGWELLLLTTGALFLRLAHVGGSNPITMSSTSYADGNWHVFGWRYDPPAMTLYAASDLDSEQSAAFGGADRTNTEAVTFGRGVASFAPNMDIALAEHLIAKSPALKASCDALHAKMVV